jgi:hypothetical protein
LPWADGQTLQDTLAFIQRTREQLASNDGSPRRGSTWRDVLLEPPKSCRGGRQVRVEVVVGSSTLLLACWSRFCLPFGSGAWWWSVIDHPPLSFA